jgi:hypothetical protein
MLDGSKCHGKKGAKRREGYFIHNYEGRKITLMCGNGPDLKAMREKADTWILNKCNNLYQRLEAGDG